MTKLTPPAEGDNSEVPETFLDYYGEYARAVREKDEKVVEVRHVLKRAKSAGCNIVAMQKAHKNMRRDTDELILERKAEERAMAWLGRPIGTQGALDILEPSKRAVAARDKLHWEDEGYQSALQKTDHDACPYDNGSEARVVWLVGHSNGTAFMNKTVREPEPRTPRTGRRGAKGKPAAETIN